MESLLSLSNVAGFFAMGVVWVLTELSRRVPVVAELPKPIVVSALSVGFGVGAYYLGGFDVEEAMQAGAIALNAAWADGLLRRPAAGQRLKETLSGKAPTEQRGPEKDRSGSNIVPFGMRSWLVVGALLAVAGGAMGCSSYRVVNESFSYDDTGKVKGREVNKISNLVPFGGKDASLGSLGIDVKDSGAYKVELGQQSETDLLGTGDAVVGMQAVFARMILELARENAELRVGDPPSP